MRFLLARHFETYIFCRIHVEISTLVLTWDSLIFSIIVTSDASCIDITMPSKAGLINPWRASRFSHRPIMEFFSVICTQNPGPTVFHAVTLLLTDLRHGIIIFVLLSIFLLLHNISNTIWPNDFYTLLMTLHWTVTCYRKTAHFYTVQNSSYF